MLDTLLRQKKLGSLNAVMGLAINISSSMNGKSYLLGIPGFTDTILSLLVTGNQKIQISSLSLLQSLITSTKENKTYLLANGLLSLT